MVDALLAGAAADSVGTRKQAQKLATQELQASHVLKESSDGEKEDDEDVEEDEELEEEQQQQEQKDQLKLTKHVNDKKKKKKKKNNKKNKNKNKSKSKNQNKNKNNNADEKKENELGFELKLKPTHRGINQEFNCDSMTSVGQTWPPSNNVHDLFRTCEPPAGQVVKYQTKRISDAETRNAIASKHLLESEPTLRKLRLASECHRQVRAFAHSFIKPGIKLIDMCEQIEEMNRKLIGEAGLEAGIGFPTGCSLNHVAAHFSPNPGDETRLGFDDVMKVDFGSHIDGHIIDCAWTVSFNPKFDPLLEAVKAATEAGIKAAGIDVRLGDIGTEIQEVMESHEIELDGKTFPIKSVRNLSGHSIEPYNIHGGKFVPIVKSDDATKMEEGEIFAIETFGTTGRGYVLEDMTCSHFKKVVDAPFVPLRLPASKKLLSHINKTFDTLAFCPRWLEREDGGSMSIHGKNGKVSHYRGALKNLCDVGIIEACPPLCDVKGSYVAQYEHTIILRSGCKEVLSRGADF